ncbi:MAG: hypothetical protein JO368_10545, partial [Acidimicrobiales bacterium]|nr:hypothetical protein [Acidimicrobiales bacterium]
MTTPASEPAAAGEGTPRRRARSTTRSTTRSTARSSTRRSETTASAAPAPAKRTRRRVAGTAASGAATVAALAFDPSLPESGGENGMRPWADRGRSARGLYDRSRQRRWEQWSLAARGLSWLFARPELVLAALGSPPPVEANGRVLHRGVQALLEVLERAPGSGDNEWGPGADIPLARKRMRQMGAFAAPLRTDVYSSGRLVPGPDGAPSVPVRVYRRFGAFAVPPSPRPPAIVYFHGGG